jgi:hypothetical protein
MKTKDLKRITNRYSHGTNGSWENDTIGWFEIIEIDEENEQITWNCVNGNWTLVTDLQGKGSSYPNTINEVYEKEEFKGLTNG